MIMIEKMNWKILFYVLMLGLFFNSCSSSGEDYANKLCSCMKESGFKEGINLDRIDRNLETNNPCFREIGKEIYAEMKGMTDQQRAHFTKEFMKAMLDTDCADIVFKAIPYNELMENMERMYGKSENDNTFGGFGQPSVCDCVKLSEEMLKEMDEADENRRKKLEEFYTDKMEACKKLSEGLSDEEMKQLMEEAKNCL